MPGVSNGGSLETAAISSHMQGQNAHAKEIDEGGVEILQALPPELRKRVAEFRVETYRLSATCASCGLPVLYFSVCDDALRAYSQYFVVRGVFLCDRCARRGDGTCLYELPGAHGASAIAA